MTNQALLSDCPVFTIFFSGHGGIHNNCFYLCPSDYDPALPSVYGISIADLIRYARDLNFKTLNIVIDACQAGYSGTDLREAIERPAKESKSPLCISIIASSLTDQYSVAGTDLSLFTKRLNDFIIGASDSLVSRPTLTLSDISPLVPEIRHSTGNRQNVVHYALNVLGPAHFCTNPLLGNKERQPHNHLLSPSSQLGTAAFEAKDQLEEIYNSLATSFSHYNLARTLRPICHAASSDLESLDELLSHYDNWLAGRASQTKDWSLSLRISAAIAAASFGVGSHMKNFVDSRARAIAAALKKDVAIFIDACDHQNIEALGLLTSTGVDAFYFTPLRLSHYYARIGLCLHAATIGLLDRAEILSTTSRLIHLFHEQAANLHLFLNESQAPHLGIFFAACSNYPELEMAEITFGLYFNDHHLTKGKTLRSSCTAAQAIEYIRQRGLDPTSISSDATCRPNTIIPILLASAKTLKLEDMVDPWLAQWDGIITSIFIPKEEAAFGEEFIASGINATRTIGSDFYAVSAYCDDINSENSKSLSIREGITNKDFLKYAISYIYPDRFPWANV